MHHGFCAGTKRTPEYNAWKAICKRCTNPRDRAYKDYGGRGIRVCGEWRHNFITFLQHVGPRPSPEHMLDRIDNNGNYEPGNVRWARREIQANNTRRNIWIEAHGKRMTVAQWSKATGLHRMCIMSRIRRMGWSPEEAVTSPSARQNRQ